MLQLYPPPRQGRVLKDGVSRTGRNLIAVTGTPDRRVLNTLTAFADRHHLTVSFATKTGERALLHVLEEKGMGKEAYRLKTGSGAIRLSASSPAGFFYGLATLDQILSRSDDQIDGFSITDEPDFANRGVMLDISRCKVPTRTTLFAMIDAFARLKFNQLQLYTEHTFAFVNHPLVWADASPMTASDIIAIRSYCADRFIDLVPNLNSFGHFERWLRYPEYHKYAECPHGFAHPLSGQQMSYGSTLYPDKLSLGLLEELYDEYLPLFTSNNFNVGGDEPWELGHGRSKARCEKLGTARVYADFLDQIHKRVKARDRQMMFWSDIVLKEPDSLKHASKHATALNWGYEGNHPFQRECRQMQAAGMPYYVCPGTSSWNALTGRIDNASKNLASAARAGIANGAIGYLITDWGDHGHHQYLPTSFPGFLMGASHAWNHRSSKNLNVIDGLNRVFFADNGGKSGAVLWQLGKVLELAPSPIRNATIFNRLLFWRMQHEPGATRKITNTQLQACEEAFLGLSEQLADIAPRYDSELIRDEFDNAIRLARHGIHRLQLFRGERRDRSSLRSELKHGIAEHERLWLSRNRPGGLRESSGHLAQSLAALS